MKDGLAQWSRNIPENDPTTGQPLNLNEQSSELMPRAIRSGAGAILGQQTPHQPTLALYLEANLDFIRSANAGCRLQPRLQTEPDRQ